MTVSAKLTIRYMQIGLLSFRGYFVRFYLRKDYRLHKKQILPHCPLSTSSLCLCKPKCQSHRLCLKPISVWYRPHRAVYVPVARRDTAVSEKKRLNGRQQRQHWQLVSVFILHPAACSQRAGHVHRQQGSAVRRLTGCRRGADGLTAGATTITWLNPTVVTFWGHFVFTKWRTWSPTLGLTEAEEWVDFNSIHKS